jgi:hypothetical protein
VASVSPQQRCRKPYEAHRLLAVRAPRTAQTWTSRFADLLASHALGDYVLQTDWQARQKRDGLGGDKIARRALGIHVACYTVACSGAIVGISRSRGPVKAALSAGAIAIPHALVDDGRLLAAWMLHTKGLELEDAPPGLVMALDQSAHLLCLWALARALGDG